MSILKKVLPLAVVGSLMVATAYADENVVVIANPNSNALTKEQVSDLYLGKARGMKLLDQPGNAPVKAAFYQKVSGHDLSQVKATWARLIFTGREQPPKELADSAAVKKAVAADPKALGYIQKSEVDPSVKVVLSLE